MQIPVLEIQELRMEREYNLLKFMQLVVVEPGLKTRIQNSRARCFNNDILLTLRLTGIHQILPRSTASVDLMFHVLERIAVEKGDMGPSLLWWH